MKKKERLLKAYKVVIWDDGIGGWTGPYYNYLRYRPGRWLHDPKLVAFASGYHANLDAAQSDRACAPGINLFSTVRAARREMREWLKEAWAVTTLVVYYRKSELLARIERHGTVRVRAVKVGPIFEGFVARKKKKETAHV